MGLFDLLRGADINSRLQEMRDVEGAVLLDVRNADEFRRGHIPGAINMPVDSIESIVKKVKKKDTPIYSYCLSGARSGRAVSALKALGYTNVINIGGINRYKGVLEEGKKKQ